MEKQLAGGHAHGLSWYPPPSAGSDGNLVVQALSPAVRDLDDLEAPRVGTSVEPLMSALWPKKHKLAIPASSASDGHYQQLSSSWASANAWKLFGVWFFGFVFVLSPVVSLLYAFLLCCHRSASWT